MGWVKQKLEVGNHGWVLGELIGLTKKNQPKTNNLKPKILTQV